MIVDSHLVEIEEVVGVGRGDRLGVTRAVLDRLEVGSAFAQEVSEERSLYGRTTGVGANRGIEVEAPNRDCHDLRLLRSHATSAGPARSPERVRTLLAVRAAQLGVDGNGVQATALDGLGQLLDEPPLVREYVGLGTGDLGALATIGLAMVDRGLWQPRGDALAFCSSNAATLADAALAIHDLAALTEAGLVTAALSVVATRGNAEAFARGVEQATPFAGARSVCRTLRALLSGMGEPARIQDSFALRTLPQTYGPLLDALDHARMVTTALINAPSENPLLSPRLGVAHHGAFQAAYLGQALDSLRLALAQALQNSLGRTTLMSEPAVTGLRPFLADGAPAASGTMVLEYAAAAALADVFALAHPAGLQTTRLSRGTEDDASFASLAARHSLSSLAPARTVLAAELLCAVRAITQADQAVPPALAPVVARAAAALISRDLADRDLSDDLEVAMGLLDDLPVSAPRTLQRGA